MHPGIHRGRHLKCKKREVLDYSQCNRQYAGTVKRHGWNRLGLAEIHRSRPSPAVLTESRQSRTIGIQHLENRWRLLAARINTQRKHHWPHRRTRAIALPTAW